MDCEETLLTVLNILERREKSMRKFARDLSVSGDYAGATKSSSQADGIREAAMYVRENFSVVDVKVN